MPQTKLETIWIYVKGIRIRCLSAGESGPPVIFLHGGGVDSASLSWSGVLEAFAGRHQVFAPDLPGYGESSRPDVQYTIDFYVRAVEQILYELHLEKATLVGLSMGGAIAIALALRSPKLVDGLVLVDTYGIQDKVEAQKLSYLYVHLPLLDEFSLWLLGRSRSLVRWSLLSGIIYNPDHLSDALLDEIYSTLRKPGAGKAYISFQRSEIHWSGLSSNFLARLHEISAPTLFIHGAQDSAVPLSCAQRAHELIPSSELFIMQECRHWPQRERPDEFIKAVSDFLDA